MTRGKPSGPISRSVVSQRITSRPHAATQSTMAASPPTSSRAARRRGDLAAPAQGRRRLPRFDHRGCRRQDDSRPRGVQVAREHRRRRGGTRIRNRLDAQAGASFADLLRAEVPEIDRARPESLQRKISATRGYSVRRRPRGSSRGPGLFRRRHPQRHVQHRRAAGALRAQATARVRLPLHRLRRGLHRQLALRVHQRRAGSDPAQAATEIRPVWERTSGDQE